MAGYFNIPCKMDTELIWSDPLHTPHFQQLTAQLLECFFRHGVLDDVPEEDIPLIAKLSCLHDMGKLWLSDEIVYKPGRLSPEENSAMKRHTTLGAAMVEELYKGKEKTREYYYLYHICRHHHERWDGDGYPDRLRGNEIPRYVQIIGLADALDALLIDRSYRPRMSREDAVWLIVRGGCGTFGPQLRAIFDHEIRDILREVYRKRDSGKRQAIYRIAMESPFPMSESPLSMSENPFPMPD